MSKYVLVSTDINSYLRKVSTFELEMSIPKFTVNLKDAHRFDSEYEANSYWTMYRANGFNFRVEKVEE